MGNVTAVMMDVITQKSGHTMTGLAVSVCITPAAPSPIPLPYPTVATVSEGVIDECLRTKIDGAKVLTVGSCTKNCHGNEPGTLKEVVSLNTAGPSFPIMGAPIVFIELGMAGITLSPGFMNKQPIPGIGGSASGAGGGGGGGGGAGGGAGGPPGASTQGPSNGGGGGGGSNSAAAPPNAPAPPGADGQASGGHPIDVVTGALFTPPAQDFRLPGFFPVQWIRYYTSSAVRRDIGLGHGWTCSLHWIVRLDRDGATLVDEAGREARLPPIEDGEVAVLPYGRRVRRSGADLIVEAGDAIERVLRAAPGEHEMRLVELRDKHGHLADIEWEDGRITAIVDTVGRRAVAQRNGRSTAWTVTVTGEGGAEHRRRLITYETDERGDLVRTIDAGGVITEYAYDEEHFMVQERRPDGLVFCFQYEVGADGKKRCVETWGEIPGRNVLAEMHLEGAAPAGVRGVYHTKLVFEEGLESRLTDALGHTQRYRGNAFGLVDVHVDPRGYQRLLRYDGAGHLVSVTEGGRATTRRAFDAFGRLASHTDTTGSVTRLHHDEEGNTVRVDTAEGAWKWKWEKGLVKERTEADGRQVEYEYDGHGYVTSARYSNGDVETMEYDAHGNMTRFVATNGQVWSTTYDLFGQPVRIEMPGGAVYEMMYDSRGLLVVSKGPEGRLEYDNDGLGRVVQMRHTSGGVSTFKYVGDALVERTYPDGTRWRMGYDACSRLVAIENPLGERYQLHLDEEGAVTGERTFAGLVYRYERDGNGFVHRTLCPDESTMVSRYELSERGLALIKQHASGVTERFEYDTALRLVRAKNAHAELRRQYDEGGRLIKETQIAGGHEFSFEYDLDEQGRHQATRYSTGWSVHAERGKGGRLERIGARRGEREESLRIVFGDDGRERSRAAEGSPLVVSTERDAIGRPTRIAIGEEGKPPLRTRQYAWSAEGPLARIDDDRRGTRKYTLDAMGRPLRVVGLGAEETFTFSPLGIPMDRDLGPGPVGRPRRAGGALLHWDRLGRLAMREGPDAMSRWQYHYDEADRLVAAVRGDGLRVQYLYDPLGRRLAESAGGITTWFFWEGNTIVEEVRTSGERVRRVFADDARTELMVARNEEPFRHVVSDAASTPWLFLGQDGEAGELDLTTWGNVAFESGETDSLRFAGQRFDPITGLSYNRHRYYAPDLATFITPDPGGMRYSLLDVAFVPNVTFYIDALGLWTAIIRTEDDDVITRSTARYTNGAPAGSQTFSHADIDAAIANGQNPLAGATNVVVVGHGAPGSIGWGPDRPIIGSRSINGQELGQKLKGAGFNGGPGTQVDVVSCNAGTKPFFGQSVAQGVATETQSPSTGAVANNRLLGYLGMGGTTRTGGGAPGIPAYESVDRGSIQPFSP